MKQALFPIKDDVGTWEKREKTFCWIGSFPHPHPHYPFPNPLLVEGVLILRNISLKFKTVVDNAILLNYAVSSENISESIKIKREFGFLLKVNVCKFR